MPLSKKNSSKEGKHLSFDLAKLFNVEDSISMSIIKDMFVDYSKYFNDLKQERENHGIPFLNVLHDSLTKLEEIKSFVEQVRGKYDYLLIIGIGGSTLGFRALFSALCHTYYNSLEKEKRSGFPKVYVLDNADPEEAENLLDIIELEKTCLTYISKTGATPEPAANFLYFLEKYLAKGLDQSEIVIISDPGDRGINKIAKEFSCKVFSIPNELPGRYSVLSSVGLFPAEMIGINSGELINGAFHMDEFIFKTPIEKNPVFLVGLIDYLLDKKGKNIRVLMPYSGSLFQFGLWYIQLWAESLGKEKDLSNNNVNVGTTPILALGATDQHSQLQLFKEGPNDKLFCFISIEKYKKDAYIKKQLGHLNEYSYFGDHTMAELISIEQKATESSLSNANRPSYSIILPEITPFTMGQLIYFFELLVNFISKLYNINPFNQPGVEEGKVMTYSLMGREGYQHLKEGFLEKISRKSDFLF